VNPSGEFNRDTEYVSTRITADGRDGYPVEPGRYRLIVSRACPWASRAIVVRRLLGQERPVRALIRSDAAAEVLSGTGAELIRGDLRDPAGLAAAVAGVERSWRLPTLSRRPALATRRRLSRWVTPS